MKVWLVHRGYEDETIALVGAYSTEELAYEAESPGDFVTEIEVDAEPRDPDADAKILVDEFHRTGGWTTA